MGLDWKYLSASAMLGHTCFLRRAVLRYRGEVANDDGEEEKEREIERDRAFESVLSLTCRY